MRIQILFFLLLALGSCSKGRPAVTALTDRIDECFTPLEQANQELSGTLFFMGPELDSVNMKILAPCDCCASNLAFVNDSLFVYESLCLEEDVYSKGNYVRAGNLVILEVQPPSVSHIHEPGPDMPESWETSSHKTDYVALNLSELNNRMVLSITYDQETTDYGLPESSESFISMLKKEGVWKRLNL